MKKTIYSFILGASTLLLTGCPNSSSTAAAAQNQNTLSSTSQAYAGVNGPQASILVTVSSNSSVSHGVLPLLSATISTVPDLQIQVAPGSLPAGMSAQYQDAEGNISSSGCASTNPGDTCTILLTGNGSVTPGNYILQVISTNAPALSIPLNVQWPTAALTASGATDSTYTLNLTNTSAIPLTGLTSNITTIPSGWTVDQSVNDCGTTLAAGASCVLATVTYPSGGQNADSATVNVTGSNLQSSSALAALSPFCSNNVSNFQTEETEAPYYIGNNPQIDPNTGIAWGPNIISPIAIDSNILGCATNTTWGQERANAVAMYWIGQK